MASNTVSTTVASDCFCTGEMQIACHALLSVGVRFWGIHYFSVDVFSVRVLHDSCIMPIAMCTFTMVCAECIDILVLQSPNTIEKLTNLSIYGALDRHKT